MRIVLEVPRSLELYQDALEGLTRINERMYRQARLAGRPLSSIVDREKARVRYVGEYPGQEDWKHVGRLLEEREGDCEDLSAARAGELRDRGIAARAIIRRITPALTHAYVALPGDRYEDPSRRLGMGPPGRPWRWKGPMIPMQDDDEVGGVFRSLRQVADAKRGKPAARRAIVRPTPPARPGAVVRPASPARAEVRPGPAMSASVRPMRLEKSPVRLALPPPSATTEPPAEAWGPEPSWGAPAPAPAWDDPGPWGEDPEAWEEDTGEPSWGERGAVWDDQADEEQLAIEERIEPRGARRAWDADNWDAVGADVSQSPEVTWTIDRTPTGWRGTVRVPLELGRMLTTTRTVPRAEGASGATSAALNAASKVLDNPAVAALLPPQAKMALQLARSKTARNIAKKITKLF